MHDEQRLTTTGEKRERLDESYVVWTPRTKLQSSDQVPKSKALALPTNYAKARKLLSTIPFLFHYGAGAKQPHLSRIVQVYLQAARYKMVRILQHQFRAWHLMLSVPH
jgi:hypothetical protein